MIFPSYGSNTVVCTALVTKTVVSSFTQGSARFQLALLNPIIPASFSFWTTLSTKRMGTSTMVHKGTSVFWDKMYLTIPIILAVPDGHLGKTWVR